MNQKERDQIFSYINDVNKSILSKFNKLNESFIRKCTDIGEDYPGFFNCIKKVDVGAAGFNTDMNLADFYIAKKKKECLSEGRSNFECVKMGMETKVGLMDSVLSELGNLELEDEED